MSELSIQAWDTEYGDVVVWGTHDSLEGVAAWNAYCVEVGAEEYSPPHDFGAAHKFWADPSAIDLVDAPWPSSLISSEPREGWVPVMLVVSP